MIVQNNSLAFSDDPIHKMNFEKFSNNNATKNIIFHVDSLKKYENFSKIENFKYYLLDLELPNRWINHDTRYQCFENEKIYDKIFSICPYTVKHRNAFLKKNLYKSVFFPFPNEYIPQDYTKKSDVLYCGNSNFSWAEKINFKKFNSINIGGNFIEATTRITPNYGQKIQLFANSKIAITWNEYQLSDTAYNNIMTLDKIENYFKVIDKTLTQHKSRVMEAAFGKAIILCKKDNFNIIEEIFEEKKEFIYFNEDDINDILEELINNYKKYEFIAENAYRKAVELYTVSSFYEKFILNG